MDDEGIELGDRKDGVSDITVTMYREDDGLVWVSLASLQEGASISGAFTAADRAYFAWECARSVVEDGVYWLRDRLPGARRP